jgi:hypothetical protein
MSAGKKPREPGRGPPKRLLSKQEGVRHILHSAIRGTLRCEDPFAIHLLAQSAEKILIDVNTKAGLPDPLFSMLKPGRATEFFAIYRESYNFLKHADKDGDGYLEVHEIVGSNDLSLFMSTFRYGTLFGKYTAHMFCMMMFAAVQYPGIITWEAIPDLKGKVMAALTLDQTRAELADSLALAMSADPACQAEMADDLTDVRVANRAMLKPIT